MVVRDYVLKGEEALGNQIAVAIDQFKGEQEGLNHDGCL